jgi:hypothetical protein
VRAQLRALGVGCLKYSHRSEVAVFATPDAGRAPALMKNMLVPWVERFGGRTEAGTMTLANAHCKRVLPTGFFARWSA